MRYVLAWEMMERGIWAFAYVDGGFRYIGNTHLGFGRLKNVHPAPVVGSKRHPRIRASKTEVDVRCRQPKMIHQVQPVYPDLARRAT